MIAGYAFMAILEAVGLFLACEAYATWAKSGLVPNSFGLFFLSSISISVPPVGAWMMYRSWNTPRKDFPPLGSVSEPDPLQPTEEGRMAADDPGFCPECGTPGQPVVGACRACGASPSQRQSFALPDLYSRSGRIVLLGFFLTLALGLVAIPFLPAQGGAATHTLWLFVSGRGIAPLAYFAVPFVAILWAGAGYIGFLSVRLHRRAHAGKLVLDDRGVSLFDLEGKLWRVDWSRYFSLQITDLRSADPNWGDGIVVSQSSWGPIRLSTEAAEAIIREAKRHGVEVTVTINPKTHIGWYVLHR
jgi:hypothetical protein